MMAIDDLLKPRTGAEGSGAPPDMSKCGLLYLVSDGTLCARGGATAWSFSLSPCLEKAGNAQGGPGKKTLDASMPHREQNGVVRILQE